MRHCLIITLFISFGISEANAQKANPPGTIYLRDNLYIDLAPVANVHYREYEYVMSRFFGFDLESFRHITDTLPEFGVDGLSQLKSLRFSPNSDSLKMKINKEAIVSWTKESSPEVYYNHPSYNYYPLVNAPYSLAKLFCEWRTLTVMFLYSTSRTFNERQKLHKRVLFRLPTSEELNFAFNKFKTGKQLSILKSPLPAIRKKFTVTNLSEFSTDGTLINWTNQNNSQPDMITFRCICEVED